LGRKLIKAWLLSQTTAGFDSMVYCAKCGSKNEDNAETCTGCGATLQMATGPRMRARKRAEDECFGLPYGGVIVGLIIGVIIVVWGLSQVPGVLPEDFSLWWLIIIVFGLLIIAGALFRLIRR